MAQVDVLAFNTFKQHIMLRCMLLTQVAAAQVAASASMHEAVESAHMLTFNAACMVQPQPHGRTRQGISIKGGWCSCTVAPARHAFVATPQHFSPWGHSSTLSGISCSKSMLLKLASRALGMKYVVWEQMGPPCCVGAVGATLLLHRGREAAGRHTGPA
jgi:hypothetical protein